jgi:hypothetical protein
MSEAIQDAISALEDERTVLDQKITAVRDAVMERIDEALDTLRGLAGGTTKPKKTARPLRPSVRPSVQRQQQTSGASLT